MRRPGPDEWKRLISEFDQSQLTQKEFCAEKQYPSDDHRWTPARTPVSNMELAGKLVHREIEYKLAMDTVRIACENAEAELAPALAPLLPRAAEAKKLLANVFAAPGRVHVNTNAITVTLRPPGTKHELEVFAAFALGLNNRGLILPGDQRARWLRFRIHQVS